MQEEMRKGYSMKLKPSVVIIAKDLMKDDEDIKSFNNFLEQSLIDYSTKRLKHLKKDKQ